MLFSHSLNFLDVTQSTGRHLADFGYPISLDNPLNRLIIVNNITSIAHKPYPESVTFSE